MQRSLHVAPGDHDDWVVREEGGRELGHYPTRQEAEAVGRKLAQKRKAQLLIRARSGEVERLSRRRPGWFARLIGR